MFTGLVEKTGTLKGTVTRGNYRILTIGAPFNNEPLNIGESIACDGACLTVTSAGKSTFTVDVSQESLARTIIGGYRVGVKINLERAVRVGDRLGGHMVSGHIDHTGVVDSVKSSKDSLILNIGYDKRFDHLVVGKGSIAVNGVSLTINETRSGWLSVNIIPHTANMTNLGLLKQKHSVNLEFDIIGKYIARMTNKEHQTSLTIDKLRESGW